MVFYLSNLLLRAKRIKGNKIGVILTLISLVVMSFYVLKKYFKFSEIFFSLKFSN